VLSRALLPPDNMTDPMLYDSQKGSLGRIHNYTDCCMNSNVSSSCFGFCNIQSILEGNTGQDPENCERDFPAIVKCMAGKRVLLGKALKIKLRTKYQNAGCCPTHFHVFSPLTCYTVLYV